MEDVDWNRIRAFLATVDAGSLSGAAREIGLTQPTLSRQVAALEAELNVTLFERIGKKLVLTEAGVGLATHARAMGEAAAAMALTASGHAQAIGGRVSVSASDSYAAYLLPEIVERLRREAPQITLVIVSSNSLSDLRRREADIAIRHVRPEDEGLIGKLLGESTAHFFASESWVARRGRPGSISDISPEDLIAYEEGGRFEDFMRSAGVCFEEGGFKLISESSVVVWEMVKRGLGIAVMSREVASRTEGVVDLFAEMEGIPFPTWIVTHRELRTSPRIRIVYDIVARELARAQGVVEPGKRPVSKRLGNPSRTHCALSE